LYGTDSYQIQVVESVFYNGGKTVVWVEGRGSALSAGVPRIHPAGWQATAPAWCYWSSSVYVVC